MSLFRRTRPGDDVDAYCTRCKRDLTHTVLTMADEDTPERVRCNTCRSHHRYVPERSAGTPQRSSPPVEHGDEPRLASLPPAREETDEMDSDALVAALRELLEAAGAGPPTRIAPKFDGGTLVLKPGKPGLQEKEIPIETFFKKLVTVRDRLRVLEQQINAAEKLSDGEKLHLQQYITRCYGSLTTFNVLFDSRDDWFVGESSNR